MSTLIHQFVAECQAGTNPRVICRVSSGWVVLGDPQVVRGYSLIYPDPVVPDLNALNADDRKTLLYEASLLGDAVLEVTGAVRINYEILGNLEPALHVHVFPRYEDEPDDLKTKPIWFSDWEQAIRFDPERDAALKSDILAYLQRAGITA
ncbi:HIT family protein [Calycomorphotria hydatis]|uniref:HIT domain-containing protein n=1 Tax=Calycomorphotria hydatis TaxID=2528027 RepID=A0A517TFA0_9PLAN|nr:HIT domain-containing protein [Calycomorphotria hydatis]QDT67038.1 hypothetical protein V22_43100 [Calycomorphotria hydatis]